MSWNPQLQDAVNRFGFGEDRVAMYHTHSDME